MTQFYELNSQPNLTASEALLLNVIQNLALRVNSLEMAVRSNLPAVHNMLPHNDIREIFDFHRYDFSALLRDYGTSRTRQQLEMQGPFTDPETSGAEAISRLCVLMAQRPVKRADANWPSEGHGYHSALSRYYTTEEIRAVFLKMAVEVDKLPTPSVSGEGWNVVTHNEVIYAFYTYAKPNRVSELVWSGPIDPAGKEHQSQFNSSCRLYLPLEAAWVHASLVDYVPFLVRQSAIQELFTAQGMPQLTIQRPDDMALQGKVWRFKDMREMSKRGTELPLVANVSDGERNYPNRERQQHHASIRVEGKEFRFTVNDRDEIKGGDFHNPYPLSVLQRLHDILSDATWDPVVQVMLDERRAELEELERQAEERKRERQAAQQPPAAE